MLPYGPITSTGVKFSIPDKKLVEYIVDIEYSTWLYDM